MIYITVLCSNLQNTFYVSKFFVPIKHNDIKFIFNKEDNYC